MKRFFVSSLRAKFLIMFIVLTVIPLVLVGMISYQKAVTIITENSIANAQLKGTQLSQEIDGVLQNMLLFTDVGKQEHAVRFLMNDWHENDYEDAKSILSMFATYREIIPMSRSIIDMTIINLNGKSLSERKGLHIEDSPIFPHIITSEQNYTTPRIELVEINDTLAFSITQPIIWDITHETIGFVNLIVDQSIIQSLLEQMSEEQTGQFVIHSDNEYSPFLLYIDDMLMVDQTIESDFQTYVQQISSDPTLLVTSHKSEISGWTIYGIVPEKDIMKEANSIRNLIMLTVICSIIFTISLYVFITSRLIRPIRHLNDKIKRASNGDLNVKVLNQSQDEIAELGQSFNLMIERIKTLLETSINKEKQLKMAEFRALQAQINPHFLYNTLDTIVWMAEAKKEQDVIMITKALSQFFRISLSKGEDFITIHQEIEHIENYLIIQKKRYRDILDVQITINHEINTFIIHKLTLQPLVENAIYHGIKNKRGKGLIHIVGDFDKKQNICFKITDNGLGIKEEQLLSIKARLLAKKPLQTSSIGGYGLFNVQERIRLYYGEPYGIEIDSIYGLGTTVHLTIPAVR